MAVLKAALDNKNLMVVPGDGDGRTSTIRDLLETTNQQGKTPITIAEELGGKGVEILKLLNDFIRKEDGLVLDA